VSQRIRSLRQHPITGVPLVAIIAVAALALSLLDVVPVRSQALTLEGLRATRDVPLDDPWDAVWNTAPSRDVPLSAQNVAVPFGGGTVQALTARALHDGERIYLLLEWADDEPQQAVNGFLEFSDAAAVQFPAAEVQQVPPFTMGGPGQGVNIWQWKAVWQADMESGFTGSLDRYPDTYTDYYPGGEDPLYKPALFLRNPVAQREHTSSIENLVAEGFGTLTTDDTQDVSGSGVWREGRWRALFARSLEPAGPGLARFEVGVATNVAFAVWDGGSDDRNGQKSIAPFIGLSLSSDEAGSGFGGAQVLVLALVAVAIAVLGAYALLVRRPSPAGA
jgi:hypothetical protein